MDVDERGPDAPTSNLQMESREDPSLTASGTQSPEPEPSIKHTSPSPSLPASLPSSVPVPPSVPTNSSTVPTAHIDHASSSDTRDGSNCSTSLPLAIEHPSPSAHLDLDSFDLNNLPPWLVAPAKFLVKNFRGEQEDKILASYFALEKDSTVVS